MKSKQYSPPFSFADSYCFAPRAKCYTSNRNDIKLSSRRATFTIYRSFTVTDLPIIPMGHQDNNLQLPHGGKLSWRPVTNEDESFLVELYGSTRAEELAQVEWAEGQKEQFVRWQFDLQRREYSARFPNARYEVVLVDSEPAGRIWIGEDSEQIRLLDIALLPQFQRRGVGTVLLRRLIDEARAAQKPLRHMVFVLNNDGHRFYERLGFVVIDDLGAYKHMEWRKPNVTA